MRYVHNMPDDKKHPNYTCWSRLLTVFFICVGPLGQIHMCSLTELSKGNIYYKYETICASGNSYKVYIYHITVVMTNLKGVLILLISQDHQFAIEVVT